ncbi:TnsD family Tn7-like transposition protein [Paraburkholderia bannensis]|uniref:TnsD family Tn7-like transposition protein n=1 Tax=Paraburkholderia bannensis TaxID=765414 RepID=UPI002AB78FAD|nr:TnsD family Tn7-like transposition protein [Paraburkholderia bannensis]
MAVDIDYPFPDEPLFSTVARYMADLRVGGKARFLKKVFGYRQRLSVTLAHGLDQFAEETSCVWNLDSRELAERFTLYPYYAALLPAPVRDALLANMRQKGRKQGPLIVRPTLRFCEACRAADRTAGRPAYWRRSHQLPGVLLCPEHGTYLTEISSRNLNFYEAAWPALQHLSVVNIQPVALDLTLAQLDACQRVTRASVWLLNHRVSVDLETTLAQFKSMIWKAGYTFGPHDLDRRKLTRDFIDFYGESYLAHLESLPSPGVNNWLAAAAYGHLTHRFTTRAVLMGIFVDFISEQDSDAMWPVCPNKIAPHGPGHIVECRHKAPSGRLAAKCSCGFCFTYSRTEGGIPQDVRATFFGHSHTEFVRNLASTGATLTDISKAIEANIGVVSRILEKQPVKPRVPPPVIVRP